MDESDDMSDRTPLLQQTFSSSAYDDCLDDLETVACLTGNISDNEHIIQSFEPRDSDLNAYNENIPSIVCIFVVAFDNRAGNILEWALPSDCNLAGIEFKAMASGSHKVQTDFIYFKRDQFYGLACFENMSVDIAEERGARMKSIGVLSASYSSLHQHKQFLKNQVRFLLEHPDHYDALITYYEEKKGILSSNFDITVKNFMVHKSLSLPNLAGAGNPHPAGCFSHFVNFFGNKIFALWRLSLMKKRILFFSSPPIGIVCYKVYSTSCLAAHSIKDIRAQVIKPLFYINIADIELLEDELFYIACTTEKIFESKVHLYDLYIDNRNFKVSNPALHKMLVTSNADKLKYSELCQLRSESMSSLRDNQTNATEEMWFIRYFLKLNNLLFSTLLEASKTKERQWTRDHMKKVGLDAIADRQFIKELAELYAIDVIVNAEKSYCPSFPLCPCCS